MTGRSVIVSQKFNFVGKVCTLSHAPWDHLSSVKLIAVLLFTGCAKEKSIDNMRRVRSRRSMRNFLIGISSWLLSGHKEPLSKSIVYLGIILKVIVVRVRFVVVVTYQTLRKDLHGGRVTISNDNDVV